MCFISIATALGTSIATALGLSVGTAAAAGTAAGTVAGTAIGTAASAATAAGVSASAASTAALVGSIAPGAASVALSTNVAATLGIATATNIGYAAAVGAATSTAATAAAGAAISTGAATVIGLGAMGAGVLAIGGGIAGGVTGIVTATQQAEQQEAMAEYQADMELRNARIAAIRAEKIDMEADQKRAALVRESQQTLGTARTGYAASGVVLGSGVTLDYEADVADVLDLDMRNLNYDVKSQQWQQRVQATNAGNQSLLYKAQAKGYRDSQTGHILGGVFKTTSSTLGTALGVGSAIKSFT